MGQSNVLGDERIHADMNFTYAEVLHKFDTCIICMTSEARPLMRMEDADVGCTSFILMEKY